MLKLDGTNSYLHTVPKNIMEISTNTSAALKPLFFQRGPVIWKVGVNVALGLDVADVCCQFGKVH